MLSYRRDFGLLNRVKTVKYHGDFQAALDAFCIIIQLQTYGGQGVECSSLNEKGPQRIMCLNACFLVGETVSEGLGQ